jgi:hypothetical protein
MLGGSVVVIRFPSASVRLCLHIPTLPGPSVPSPSSPPALCPFLRLRSLSLSSLHFTPLRSLFCPSLPFSSLPSALFLFLSFPSRSLRSLPCCFLFRLSLPPLLPLSRSLPFPFMFGCLAAPLTAPRHCLSLTVVFFPLCPGLPFFSLAFPSSTCASRSRYFPSCPHNAIRLHSIHFLSVRCFRPASSIPYVLVLPCRLCNIHPTVSLPFSSRCLCYKFIVPVLFPIPWSGFRCCYNCAFCFQ